MFLKFNAFVNLFSGDKNKFVFTARRAAAL